MKEIIFNLFLIVEDNIIYELGAVSHDIEGTDEEKINFLKSSVEVDSKEIIRFKLSENFKLKIGEKEYYALNYDRYIEMIHNGTFLIVFENIFQHFRSSPTPFICITVISGGQIQIDGVYPEYPEQVMFPSGIHETLQPDFVLEYFSENEFKLSDLINDDFFEAIRVTFNAKLYVSSIKLLMSCIDTIAYLEYGDSQGNFMKWLDTFTDLSDLSLNSEELWEFRNSVLHMTNLDSRKVINQRVNRIRFYVSKNSSPHLKKSDEWKYFNYQQLIPVIANGIVNWGKTYNSDRKKIDLLIERYDRILSDKRYGHVIIV